MKRRRFLRVVGSAALGLLLRKLPRYDRQPTVGVGSALGCSYGSGSFGLTVRERRPVVGIGRISWRVLDTFGLTAEL